MARLLPRLLAAVARSKERGTPVFIPPTTKARGRLRSRYEPPRVQPSLHPGGRTRSILLEDTDVVAPPRRHKRQPPWPRLAANQRRPQKGDHDPPRLMTEQERQWFSSPYLRMLSSPLRNEKLTDRTLPSAFLIRCVALRLPQPRDSRAPFQHLLVPDGLLHPRYALPRSGAGAYILCRRDGLDHIPHRLRSNFLRYIPYLRIFPNQLGAQITHQLRLRILQEAEMLALDLVCRPRGAREDPLIRRLTRREFADVKAGKPLDDKGAIAVLVVPPVNRDAKTKKRPELVDLLDTAPPPAEGTEQPKPKREALPLSTMHLVSSNFAASAPSSTTANHDTSTSTTPVTNIDSNLDQDNAKTPSTPSTTPTQAKVPLYNGISLFPSRSQRATFHTLLSRLLKIEQQARWRGKSDLPSTATQDAERAKVVEDGHSGKNVTAGNSPSKKAKGDDKDKASHAFLLRSDQGTVCRADSVPLAIALWRLRMWESQGEGESSAWTLGGAKEVDAWDQVI